jgi:hypothetical protein
MESAENQEKSIPVNDSRSSSESSLSKTETIKLLNESIDQLEQTIKGIKDNSATIPPRDSINTLVTTTQKLVDGVASSFVGSSGSIAKKTTNQKEKVITNSAPAARDTSTQVNSPAIKPEQPNVTKTKQTTKREKKQNLTWIVIGVTAIAMAIVAIFWLWLPQQQIALVSEPAVPEIKIVSRPTDINQKPIAEAPLTEAQISEPQTISGKSGTESELLDSSVEDSALEAPVEILVPPELESPGRSKNLKMVTIEPELNFTPEQTLIASLGPKVANLTKNYPTDLIESIQVDLPQNSLLVKVTDDWYQMSESSQKKLADEMLKRSREFDFLKLELKDSLGTLVARNPVIGDRIIILQNSKVNQ